MSAYPHQPGIFCHQAGATLVEVDAKGYEYSYFACGMIPNAGRASGGTRYPDVVYRTGEAKLSTIIMEITRFSHVMGRPAAGWHELSAWNTPTAL